MLLEFITTLTEGIRTPHPEDFILNGSGAATDAIDGMLSVFAWSFEASEELNYRLRFLNLCKPINNPQQA